MYIINYNLALYPVHTLPLRPMQATGNTTAKPEEVNTGNIARMVAERAKRITVPLSLDTAAAQKCNSTVYPSSTSPVSPSTARRIITDNLSQARPSSSVLPPPPPPTAVSSNKSQHFTTTATSPPPPPPPAPLHTTDDAVSLGSSGVASAFSSLADDSSPVVHRVYNVSAPVPAPAPPPPAPQPVSSPVLLPPPMFADTSAGSNNSSFSSLRNALRSSQDNLAAV